MHLGARACSHEVVTDLTQHKSSTAHHSSQSPTQSMDPSCYLKTCQGHAETRQKEASNWRLLSRS